jgi:bifunctional N-acetylglucosamine-1-phosphate-uridyltransferase/glucosamine-1-phosphate-acetyltransferase GlmU-like protein
MTLLVIPMAGNGSRFVAEGYTTPKPLLPVNGRPMVANVIAECRAAFPDIHRVVLVTKPETADAVREYADRVVTVEKTTAGAACTVLLGTAGEPLDEPLVVANSDQTFALNAELLGWQRVFAPQFGVVLTFDGPFDPKWSYHSLTAQPAIVEKPASCPPEAQPTCGVYYFPSVADFEAATHRMIAANDRTNGEFYLAPAMNYLPSLRRFTVDRFHGLGTPADYRTFLEAK